MTSAKYFERQFLAAERELTAEITELKEYNDQLEHENALLLKAANEVVHLFLFAAKTKEQKGAIGALICAIDYCETPPEDRDE